MWPLVVDERRGYTDAQVVSAAGSEIEKEIKRCAGGKRDKEQRGWQATRKISSQIDC